MSAVVIGGIALSVVVAGISSLITDALRSRRPRKTLLERLQPYHPVSVTDEAQRGLEEQHGA